MSQSESRSASDCFQNTSRSPSDSERGSIERDVEKKRKKKTKKGKRETGGKTRERGERKKAAVIDYVRLRVPVRVIQFR